MDTDLKLMDWLYAQPLPEDLLPLTWNPSIFYHPIEKTKEKIAFMREQFGVKVKQEDVQFNCQPAYNKDTLCWGTVRFTLFHPEFTDGKWEIIGIASFFMGQYQGSWSMAQVGESLATVRGFAKDFPQFGRDINKESDPMSSFKLPPGSKKNNAIDYTMKDFVK